MTGVHFLSSPRACAGLAASTPPAGRKSGLNATFSPQRAMALGDSIAQSDRDGPDRPSHNQSTKRLDRIDSGKEGGSGAASM